MWAAAAERALRIHTVWITQHVLPEWRPTEKLGQGHYGVVFSTWDDRVVFKTTVDPKEHLFIEAALSLAPQSGVVRYLKILEEPNWTPDLDRPKAFFVWREAAYNVGIAVDRKDTAVFWLTNFEREAAALRVVLKTPKTAQAIWDESLGFDIWAADYVKVATPTTPLDRNYQIDFPRPQRVAFLRQSCRLIAQRMEGGLLNDVGRALAYYLDHGLLMTDVHAGNLGRVRRAGSETIVITDPGHAVDLRRLQR